MILDLLDWGLAIDMARVDTYPKGLCGSLPYMAPEMLQGDPCVLDERTDVFLLGATLHEALTGEYRHNGNTFVEFRTQIEECPPKRYDGVFGAMFDRILNRACAKDPNDRHASVREFKQDLELFLERRQAIFLRDLAKEEYETLRENAKQNVDMEISFSHFHRARFAYEQALEIWPEDVESKEGLADLFLLAIQFHLKRKELEVVQELFRYTKPISDQQQELFLKVKSRYEEEQRERKRVEQIGVQYDFFPSMKSFVFIVLTFVSTATLCIVFLEPLQNLDPLDVSAELLFTQSAFYLIPPLFFSVFGYKLLQRSLAIRKVATAIFGSLVVFNVLIHILHWYLYQYRYNKY